MASVLLELWLYVKGVTGGVVSVVRSTVSVGRKLVSVGRSRIVWANARSCDASDSIAALTW